MGRWMDAARAMASEAEKLPQLARRELTEPTKPGSVSFVGSDLEEITNFPDAATSRPPPADQEEKFSTCSPARPAELCNTLKVIPPSIAALAGNTNEHIPAEREAAATILRDKYEERAAILEYDANLPRAWAEHFARLELNGPPGDFSPTRWQAALDGALAFAGTWGAEAHRLGWDVSEVFGLHPTAPAARVDRRGLAWLLGDGSQVVAMDRSGAQIRKPNGVPGRYYRLPHRFRT